VSQELRKKAVEMLLAGATLVAEPCPYCGGVRVIKDGNALCINCGREPDKTKIEETPTQKQEQTQNPVLESLNKKLEQLTADLGSEKDLEKQQQILKSINLLIETIQKLKK
jgi:UPF0148 protein